MGSPKKIQVTQGTPIIWGQSGATGVTNVLSFNNLSNGAAQMGAYADLGANFDDELLIWLIVETGTAPAAGLTVDVYLLCSYDAATWPAKVTGSDASYTLGTLNANLKQAGNPVTSLIATADANTILVQAPVIWRPRGRYVVPIVFNQLGQAIRNEGTPANNDSRIIAVPRRYVVND